MDWLTFITKETEAIAWPAVAVFAMFVFRQPLVRLLERLRRFRWSSRGGIDISLDEARAEAAAAGLPIAEFTMLGRIPPDPLINLVQTFPEMGIMQSWIEIEQLLREVGRRREVDGASTRRISDVLSALRQRQLIDDQTFRLIDRLRVIRNDVVHGRTERPPTSGEALEYYSLSRALLERFRDSAKSTS